MSSNTIKIREWVKLTDSTIITDIALWLILFLPVTLYAGVVYPFNFGRLLFFVFWLTLLAGGMMSNRHLKSIGSWWKSPVIWIFLAWIIVAVISSWAGNGWSRSFWGSISRGDGLLFYIGVWLLLILLQLSIRRKERWLKLLAAISWVGTWSAIFAIIQKLGFDFLYHIDTSSRVGGLMGNPILLGAFLLLTIFFTVYFTIYSKAIGKKIVYGVGTILQLIAMLLTVSRGPIFGLVIGVLVLLVGIWLIHRKTLHWRWRWSQLGWLSIPLLIFALVGWWSKGDWSRLVQFNLQSDSVRSRLIAWNVLWDAISKRPWMGWGLENIQVAFNQFYRPGLADLGASETLFDRAHNLFIDRLVATGWIGTGVIVVLLVWALIVGIRQIALAKQRADLDRATLLIFLMATGIAYFISLLTAFDTVETLIYTVIILGTFITFTTFTDSETATSSKWVAFVPAICFVSLLVLSVSYLVPALKSGHYAIVAIQAADAGDYLKADFYFKRTRDNSNPYLAQLLWRFPAFARDYTFELMGQQQPVEAIRIASDGLTVLKKVTQAIPGNPTLAMDGPLLNVLLFKLGQTDLNSARESFNDIIKTNPNREYLYLDWGRTLTGLGEFTEAKIAFNQVAEVSPLPKEFGFWLAVWGIISHQMGEADIIRNFADSMQRQVSFSEGQEVILQQAILYLTQHKSLTVAAYYQSALFDLTRTNTTDDGQ